MNATVDGDSIVLELSSRPDSVTQARRELLAWLVARTEVATGARGAIALAVSEAVANSAVHAYGEGGQGPVVVRAELRGDRVDVSVEDCGRGFAPAGDNRGAGLGMRIIGRLADEVSMHSNQGGTVVRMGFTLPSGARRRVRTEAQERRPGPSRQGGAQARRLSFHLG